MDKNQEAFDAIKEHGSTRKASKALGVAKSTLQDRAKKHEALEREAEADGFPAGETQMYWRKTKTGSYLIKPTKNPEDYINGLQEMLKGYKPPKLTKFEKTKTLKDKLTLYPLADVHHGMLAWGEETGVDWDIKESTKTYIDYYTKLIAKSDPTKHATILNLGDFFHTNDSSNSTFASKHLLDVDSRFAKMMWTGVAMFKSVIDLALQKHEKVKVVNIKGNHDPDSCITLSIAMHYAYQNEPRVEIVRNESEFWFDDFGVTMFGANHGVRKKGETLAMNMAVKEPLTWGNSKFRHFFKGHVHHTIQDEILGVLIETFQTLTPPDAHGANGGYLSGRSLTSIQYDKFTGEESRNIVRLS